MNRPNRRNPVIFGIGLILAIVALSAFILAIPSKTVAGSPSNGDKEGRKHAIAATQDPSRSARAAAGEANPSDAHPSVLANLKVVAPVSTGSNCASCHCDPRDASTRYLAGSRGDAKTSVLTLQDFLAQGQYVPLLVMKRSVFCTSSHANLPGFELDDVIRFLSPQQQPGM